MNLMRTLFLFCYIFGTAFEAANARPSDECTIPVKRGFSKTKVDNFKFDSSLWDNKKFTDTNYKLHTLPEVKPQSTVLNDLSIIVLKNSGWTQEIVNKRIQSLRSIYAQCGIEFKRIHVVFTNSPFKEVILRNHRLCPRDDPKGDNKLASVTPYMPGPRIFLFQKFIIGPEGYAMFRNASKDNYMENTAWVAYEKFSNLAEPSDKNYEIMAHELGHLLLQASHVTKNKKLPNLMSKKRKHLNNNLNIEQCYKMKSNIVKIFNQSTQAL